MATGGCVVGFSSAVTRVDGIIGGVTSVTMGRRVVGRRTTGFGCGGRDGVVGAACPGGVASLPSPFATITTTATISQMMNSELPAFTLRTG